MQRTRGKLVGGGGRKPPSSVPEGVPFGQTSSTTALKTEDPTFRVMSSCTFLVIFAEKHVPFPGGHQPKDCETLTLQRPKPEACTVRLTAAYMLTRGLAPFLSWLGGSATCSCPQAAHQPFAEQRSVC